MVVVIPVKPLAQSKSRLAAVLSPEQRAQLSRRLLRRTIELAGQAGEVVVISRDSAVRKLARQAGAWALVEAEADLNSAVRQAVRWVAARGGPAALVLPADLPRLTLADVRQIIALGQPAPAVVLAPCRRHEGTNALLLSPPQVIAPAFGVNSFSRHYRAAQQAGLEPVVYQSEAVGFDLDVPEDLALLNFWPQLLAG